MGRVVILLHRPYGSYVHFMRKSAQIQALLRIFYFTFPGRERSPEATSNTSTTQRSGACALSFTRRPDVTASKATSLSSFAFLNGTRTSTF